LGSRAGRGYARMVGGTHGSGGLGGLAQWAGRRERLGPADGSGVRTGLGPGGPGILGWEGDQPAGRGYARPWAAPAPATATMGR
jgi:hypothetical protein